MKSKWTTLVLIMMASMMSAVAQPRIAVLDFSAGVNVKQSEIDGLSAIFNTYFEPTGYIVVERTRVKRILDEHKIQGDTITEVEMTRLGRILNVPVIVIGDVNRAMGQYNIDIRAVNVETGAIIAKDGAEWSEGTSYRETMRAIAERMSRKIPLVEFYREPEPIPEPEKPQKVNPLYRPTGDYLRFSAGAPDIMVSIAYNRQITSSFLVGAGLGFGASVVRCYDENGEFVDYRGFWQPAMPIYAEIEYRTPLYKWSLFANAKIGLLAFAPADEDVFHYDYGEDDYVFFWTETYSHFFANIALGIGYKNFNFGLGASTNGLFYGFFSYSLAISKLYTALY
ncbi:MAG: hypothetical protein IJ760_06130 [Bacteroidales bacterium]|nr:hypothetical protein [Bacteroidales bacterium]